MINPAAMDIVHVRSFLDRKWAKNSPNNVVNGAVIGICAAEKLRDHNQSVYSDVKCFNVAVPGDCGAVEEDEDREEKGKLPLSSLGGGGGLTVVGGLGISALLVSLTT